TQDVANGKLGQYKILFVPFPVMLSSDVADGIKRYAQGGGTVVAEARLAWNNERGFASTVIPGIDLDKVFGAREKLIQPADKPQIAIEASANLPGLTGVGPVSGAAFEEDLEAYPGSQVLGRFEDGEPAVIENSVGSGKTILVGSFVALGYEEHQDANTRQFLVSLAKLAGVSAEVEISGPGKSEIEVRRLVSDHEQIIFAFNESNDLLNTTLSLDVPGVIQHAINWADDRDVPFQTQDGKVLLKKTFAPGEVWVVSLAIH
ncbi:MAG: beta-galactosidase trimerization domain-containing protein, partial [Silvibacterium sp.]